jgi:hypothetical protein
MVLQWEGYDSENFPMRGDPRLRVPDDRGGGNGTLNQIGQRLEYQRLKMKLRQDALIARIDIVTGGRWRPTRQDLYKIIRGTRSVTEVEIFALAVAVSCDPIWLFVGEKPAQNVANKLAEFWQANPVPSTPPVQAVKVTEHQISSDETE